MINDNKPAPIPVQKDTDTINKSEPFKSENFLDAASALNIFIAGLHLSPCQNNTLMELITEQMQVVAKAAAEYTVNRICDEVSGIELISVSE